MNDARSSILDKPDSLIRHVKDRPDHDRGYVIDNTKIRTKHGFQPRRAFKKGLEETVGWYVENRSWWQSIRTGEYLKYYERMYKDLSLTVSRKQ